MLFSLEGGDVKSSIIRRRALDKFSQVRKDSASDDLIADKLFWVHVELNTSEHRGSHPSRRGRPYFKSEYFIFIV